MKLRDMFGYTGGGQGIEETAMPGMEARSND